MRSINVVAIVAVILAFSLGEQRLLRAAAAPSGGGLHHGSAVAALHVVPVAFEPNVGQADTSVRYLARTPGGMLLLRQGEADLVTHAPAGKPGAGVASRLGAQWTLLHHGTLERATTTLTRLEPVGANRGVIPMAVNRLPGIVNYYVGKDRSQWQTGVPTYGRIEYRNVYRGIDLAWYGTGSRLEYDWVLHPGANPAVIRLRVTGAGTPRLDRTGNLLVGRGADEIVMHRPGIYQVAGGSRQTVSGSYVLHGTTVSLRLGRYDRNRTLVIDPGITTHFIDVGGSKDDGPYANAVDGQGNSYVNGTTLSTDYPTPGSAFKAPGSGAGFDAFITKLSPDLSTIIWTAVIGGKVPIFPSYGITADGFGVDIAKNGDIVAGGDEADTDFPTLAPFMTPLQGLNGWVARLGAGDGHLIQLTEIGPTSGPKITTAVDTLAADRTTGDLYVALETSDQLPTGTGALQTAHPNTTCQVFPPGGMATTGPCRVAYIMRLAGDPTYSFQTGTYLAPTTNNTSGVAAMEVGISAAGSRLYLAGIANGGGMPVSPGAFQPAPPTGGLAGGQEPWVAVLPPSLGAPYSLSYVNPAQGTVFPAGISVASGFAVFGLDPSQQVGSTFKYDAQVGVWKLDPSTGLFTGSPGFTRVADLVPAIPQNRWDVFFDHLIIPRNWSPDVAAAYGVSGTPLELLVEIRFTAGFADTVPFITTPTMDGSGALHADANAPVVVRSAKPVQGDWIDSIVDPANGWFTRASLTANAAVGGLVSTIAPPAALAHRPAAQGTGNHGGQDVLVIGVDRPAPPPPPTNTPTATATPIPPTATPTPTAIPPSKPTKPPTKCKKNQTKKAGKCACKKGYVKKNGKCVKKKK